MKLPSHVHASLFGFDAYKRGIIIHLGLLAVYSLCFIAVYFGSGIGDELNDADMQRQLMLSRCLVATMLLHLVLLVVFRRVQGVTLVKEYFGERGSAYNLAIFRFFFFFTLGGRMIFYSANHEIRWTFMPESSRVGLPFIGSIVETLPITPSIYFTMCMIAGALCYLVCLGLFTRVAMLLLIPCLFYTVGVPMFFGKISHHHILIWVPLILCFSPLADVWSVDAWLKRRRRGASEIKQHVKYMLPFKVLWLQLAVIYFFAGIVKLWDCGLAWALSDSMVNQIRWEWIENYNRIPGFRIDNYPLLARLCGLGVIYFELLYFLLILKPAGRVWALIGAFTLHKAAGYFMNIDFANLRQVAYSYIDFDKWYQVISAKLKGKPASGQKAHTGDTGNRWSPVMKTSLRLGLFLVSLNFIFSAFKIHSFPFSSYPTYSAIVPAQITLLRADPYLASGAKINLKHLGQKAGFRWENIRPYEQRINDIFEKGDSLALQSKLVEYWNLWKHGVKCLDNVSRVDMYLETRSIVPEEREKIIRSVYLGAVYP